MILWASTKPADRDPATVPGTIAYKIRRELERQHRERAKATPDEGTGTCASCGAERQPVRYGMTRCGECRAVRRPR